MYSISAATTRISNGMASNSVRPLFNRLMSSTSLMSVSKYDESSSARARSSITRDVSSGCCMAREIMPLMPLSGVRISWLIWLRKSVRSCTMARALSRSEMACSASAWAIVISITTISIWVSSSTLVNRSRKSFSSPLFGMIYETSVSKGFFRSHCMISFFTRGRSASTTKRKSVSTSSSIRSGSTEKTRSKLLEIYTG